MTTTFRTVYADMMAEGTKALDFQDKKIADNPKNSDAWYARGLALVKLGHYREALASFDLAGEIDTKHDGDWTAKADVHKKLGEIRQAAESYPKMISPAGVLTLLPKSSAWIKDIDMVDVTQDEIAAFESELSESPLVTVDLSVTAEVVKTANENEIDVASMDQRVLYTFLHESATYLKPLLVIATDQNIDISEGRCLLSEVVIFGKKKEARKAVSTMIMGMKSIKSAITQEFLSKITLMENEVTILQNTWSNVAVAQKLILSSKDLLTAGDYQAIQKNLEDARLVMEPLNIALARAEERTVDMLTRARVEPSYERFPTEP
jgi:tetratricopeptide (TPR) repeat protein